MIVFLIYVFALLFLQGVSTHLETLTSAQLESNEIKRLRSDFGSLGDSMLSLYMSVTGGDDWIRFYQSIEASGELYAASFVFFTFFFDFALVNILTGIFVEKAVMAATPDREDRVLDQRRKLLREAQEFRTLCQRLDREGSGLVSFEDFKFQMANENMIAYMSSVGLDVDDVELFFHVVAGNESVVDIDTFVEGCMSMKGSASSLDVQKQLHATHMLRNDVHHLGLMWEERLLEVLQLPRAEVRTLSALPLQEGAPNNSKMSNRPRPDSVEECLIDVDSSDDMTTRRRGSSVAV
jgi:hypothetical protein